MPPSAGAFRAEVLLLFKTSLGPL